VYPTYTQVLLPPATNSPEVLYIIPEVSKTGTPTKQIIPNATKTSVPIIARAPACKPISGSSASSALAGIIAGLTGAALTGAYNLLRANWRPSFWAFLPPIKIRVPKFIEYYTTVPEWIDEKIKYAVKIVRWVWETIKTLVKNFITRVRKIVDWVRHAK